MLRGGLAVFSGTTRQFSLHLPFDVVQFDAENGKLIRRKTIKKDIDDVCKVQFD